MATICSIIYEKYALYHWKCVLQSCSTFQIFLDLVNSLIGMAQTCVQQYFFMSIYWYRNLPYMTNTHIKKINVFTVFNSSKKILHKEITCFNEYIY